MLILNEFFSLLDPFVSDLIKQMLINHLAKPRDCLVHVGHYENASRLESALIKPITDCCVIQAAFLLMQFR